MSICMTGGDVQRERRDREENMDYDKMKALMETSARSQQDNASRNPKSFPSRILGEIGNISVTKQENGWQPRRGGSHDYPNDISVVPNFTSTLSIYGAPSGARRALAGLLTSPGSERLRWINDLRGNFGSIDAQRQICERQLHGSRTQPSTTAR